MRLPARTSSEDPPAPTPMTWAAWSVVGLAVVGIFVGTLYYIPTRVR